MDRGDLVPDDLIIAMIKRVARAGRHARTASSSTASRAPSAQARGARRGARAARADADRRAADRRGRGGGRASASRGGGCASRASTTSTSTSTRPSTRSAATSTAAAWCSATTTSRRWSSTGSQQYHEKTAPLIGLLRAPGHAAPGRRLAQPGRGQRPDPRHARGAEVRGAVLAVSERSTGMIVRKTPEEIEAMAAAGDIVARLPRDAARHVPARRHDRRPRPGGGEVHPRRRAASRRSRATAASRPRSARRPTRWSCTASRATTSSRRGDMLSIDVGVEYEGWVADAALTVALRPGQPGRVAAC